ncbi:hypothetical protein PPL_03440 [Heterostelium album PN500]|uniref:Uncharacterized protein n=1 Tax=Heterostelium pallidum (strain ATCC 26659 / Pp 5 / PN500) TaxID=670386 RepID=D3B4W4_HETP5|nr:hypothetical protein PPL_03440 [Heterostelium album PN500]EFA84362.1 hypothetical protein PPL_03440 [Heterostelium album PN500]|eukprot:XP_020436477.1 hypothetical protein PPL_03440 [Heterostelium album PN500]
MDHNLFSSIVVVESLIRQTEERSMTNSDPKARLPTCNSNTIVWIQTDHFQQEF